MQLLDGSGQVNARPTPNPTVAPGWANNDLTGSTAPTIADPDCWNAILAELTNLLLETGLAASKTDVTQVFQAILALRYAPDTGAANAMVFNPAVPLPAAASIRDGTELTIFPGHTNTSATVTVAISGGSPIPVRYPDSSLPLIGHITANWPLRVIKAGGGSPVLLIAPDSRPGQYPGTGTNDAAAAGNTGEVLSTYIDSGTEVGLTSTVKTDLVHLDLTPGDWDVSGQVQINIAVSTTLQAIEGWISTTSATDPPTSAMLPHVWLQASFTTGLNQIMSLAPGRVSVAVSTTTRVYLGCQATFGVSIAGGYGFLRARRVR